MRLTQGFVPTIKETPNEAQIVSHRLMLRSGLVRQTSAGIYAGLPLGLRVLRHIAASLKPGTYRWYVRARATDRSEIRSRVESFTVR